MKIIKIEQVENEDVYNMEVENHHNFAVNGGFIVHNCDALRYWTSGRPSPTYKKETVQPKKLIQVLNEREKLNKPRRTGWRNRIASWRR